MRYYKEENLWFSVKYDQYCGFYNYDFNEKMIKLFEHNLIYVAENYPSSISYNLFIPKIYGEDIIELYDIIYYEYLTRKNFK